MYTIREIRIRNSPAERNRRRIVIFFSSGVIDCPVELKEDFNPNSAEEHARGLWRRFQDMQWAKLPEDIKEHRSVAVIIEILRTQGKKIQADSS